MLHFDGTTWSKVALDNGANLHGVWGCVTVLATGVRRLNVYGVGNNGVIEHSNGTTWSQVAMSPPVAANLNAVTGTGPNDIYVVGDSCTILHFDGAAWRQMTTAETANLHAVWASQPGDAWAGGEQGRILHYNGAGGPAGEWLLAQSIGPYVVRSIWGSGPNDVVFLRDADLHGQPEPRDRPRRGRSVCHG